MASEALFVLLLVLANGLFSMSEFAIISARKARLQQRADAGDRGAQGALKLADSSDQFLSAIQVGITVIGVLAGAVSGATFAGALGAWLGRIRWLAPYADTVALILVVSLITYLTLVLGELVPKRIALNNPEKIAAAVARPMRLFLLITRPMVRFLSFSTHLVLRGLGVHPSDDVGVTEEEIRALLEEGAEAGVIAEAEQDMVESVFLLGDRLASSLMTPRPDVVWLDLDDPPELLRRKIMDSPYSRFPVCEGSLDNVLGEVKAKDLLVRLWEGELFDLRAMAQAPLYVPEIMPALKVLEEFRQSGTQLALVIDEYGSVQGVVTLTDILEAIVGDIPSAATQDQPQVVRREDGSWLVDGMLPIEEFKSAMDLEDLPGEEQGLYQTVAGFVVSQLGQVPDATDHFVWEGLRFEVMDMDGPRVDKILVAAAPSPVEGEPAEGD